MDRLMYNGPLVLNVVEVSDALQWLGTREATDLQASFLNTFRRQNIIMKLENLLEISHG